ncbi:hypothetical protein tinsulaeT_30020 [Thalassotalea insulae]|uniref:DUF6680 domain-containing protein n=1 Tax=Thalassotalea insulae TaxID=2056778 RepID=A0ABQ6GUV4_9GAMM|nr:DUF6680 family protein [Thalassotalea insulae]GLX79662.1 hypothetical protein tinsulaeT_30020 [Thalassotalea insulae]
MTISDWVMILSVFSGPIVAVQLTKYLDAKKEKRQRKLDIFKTLMATRSYSTSWDHVMTLNRIDLEFELSQPKEKAVIEAWKQYLDLLNDKTISSEQWGTKRIELFVDLLHKMALVLGYDFDKTHIKNSSYSPMAHGNIDNQQAKIREGIIEILEGKRFVPMKITNRPEQS